MQTLGKVLTVILAVAAGMGTVAAIKKPASVYKNAPEAYSP